MQISGKTERRNRSYPKQETNFNWTCAKNVAGNHMWLCKPGHEQEHVYSWREEKMLIRDMYKYSI